ncbi:MAG TPA: hypothetical protein VE781_15185, partial [Kineosporiaceae bacterium]|nr:hypothetical protein [Kineosporiaceae bacterium]
APAEPPATAAPTSPDLPSAPPAAAASNGTPLGSGATGSPAPSASSSRPPAPEAPAAELDLNAVVLPALARRYGPGLLAGLLALVVVRLLVRRRR